MYSQASISVRHGSLTWDVIVVGAGPSGCAAARACAEKGLSTLCIEEHGTIGYPVQCAGLLSTSAFEECNVSRASIQNEVSGARMVSDLGGELLFDARTTKACIVDRTHLDREMAKRAADAGAEFLLKTSVVGIQGSSLLTRGVRGREEIPFRLTIAADGARSSIARMLGLRRSALYLGGVQAEVPYSVDPRYVELHPNASPDFFGWVIPVSATRARIGLCAGSTQKTTSTGSSRGTAETASTSSAASSRSVSCLRRMDTARSLSVMPRVSPNPHRVEAYTPGSGRRSTRPRSRRPAAGEGSSMTMPSGTTSGGGRRTSGENSISG